MSREQETAGRPSGLSRRRFLAASAGAAAAGAGLATLGPAAMPAFAANGVTVPPGKRGIQLYTVRDVVTRTPNPALGIGGGFRYIFEQLAGMGYKQVEFAGYTQSTSILGRQITPAEIRQLLDDNGLEANGSHIGFSDASIEAQLDIAETLGMPHLGTASIPTGSRYKEDWQRAADNFNRWGAAAAARGIKLYQHNHHAEYNFLLDSGPLNANGKPTASSGMRCLEYFFTLVDPELVWFEMDIYWGYVAQHRYQTYTDANGVAQTSIYDPLVTVGAAPERFPLFHVKDGAKANNADGYTFVPVGAGVMPLQDFLNAVAKKGYHYPNYEQDNAPGSPTTAPNQSLQSSQYSYDTIASWRG
jgi:sugar phosphate isomerase/epimerase